MIRLIPAVAAVLLAWSCDFLGIGIAETMRVTTLTGGQASWRDTVIEFINGTDDPKGLAGLEVVIHGDGIERRTYAAEDLPSHTFGVPEHGIVNVDVRLRQDRPLVAAGRAGRELEPDVKWEVEFDRAPVVIRYRKSMGPNPSEYDQNWCHSLWRFVIGEDVQNYEGESLWLSIFAFRPGRVPGSRHHLQLTRRERVTVSRGRHPCPAWLPPAGHRLPSEKLKLFPRRRLTGGGGVAGGHGGPVHHVPEGGQVVCPAVLIVQVVRVLPYIHAQERCVSLHQRAVLIRGGIHGEVPPVADHEPRPAAAEAGESRLLEGRLEIIEGAARGVDGGGKAA